MTAFGGVAIHCGITSIPMNQHKMLSMETTTIAGTKVSRIGLGTWAIGGLDWGAVPDEVAVATCLSAVERGINLIDTAPIYGHGRSEEIVGKAMRAHGRREAFFIATKAGLEWTDARRLRQLDRAAAAPGD